MILIEKLFKIYPELKIEDFGPEGTILLQDDSDGKGAYIVKWEHPKFKKPTKKKLDSIQDNKEE